MAFVKELIPIAVGIIGQSNEHGSVLSAGAATYPQAFRSLLNSSVCVPLSPAVTLGGGWWFKVYDDLLARGYEAQIVNGASGSMSMILHAAGFFYNGSSRSYSGFGQKRIPSWPGDRGYVGDLLLKSGVGYFRCTKGNHRFAISHGPGTPFPNNGGAAYTDGVTALPGGSVSYGTFAITAASEPTFVGPKGNVVVDGTVEWTFETSGGDATYPSPGGVFTEANKGVGFDPYGILQDVHEKMQAIRDVERKIIYIANGQADLGNTAPRYQSALESVANFFLSRGYEVMIGFTCFNPNNGNITDHNTLVTGVNAAITALQAGPYGSKVFAGANLFASMGTTGPMALGGAFMEADNVHLNGAGCVGADVSGVSCAGKYVMDAFAAILPDRRPLTI